MPWSSPFVLICLRQQGRGESLGQVPNPLDPRAAPGDLVLALWTSLQGKLDLWRNHRAATLIFWEKLLHGLDNVPAKFGEVWSPFGQVLDRFCVRFSVVQFSF